MMIAPEGPLTKNAVFFSSSSPNWLFCEQQPESRVKLDCMAQFSGTRTTNFNHAQLINRYRISDR